VFQSGVGNHTVVGIDFHVTTSRELRVVACALDCLTTHVIGFARARFEFLLHGERDLKRDRRDGLHEQLADRVVERAPVDLLTDRLGALDAMALTHVVRDATTAGGMVTDRHPLAAHSADRQALK
jgi:hypothetical protein